ncbi:hypothetical protein [Methylobacterium sp. yr596]|uniref:hypothetical protein n=1 Tax=Methylobacterium sp. yr596 TaxID=1761800 RepID=UPI0008EBF0E6|nr:hypothetical protein [Methylobacterium sp. yr596]SFF76936.1 hypothetical protein SAMN04487844_14722 [Methylobacterium sp. yr596]
MRLRVLALLGALLPWAASAQELRPPPSIAPIQIIGSTASGRSVLTGTAAQGATALGLGTANAPTFAGATFNAAIALPTFIVSTLPAGTFGGLIHVANARKVGEASGSGTGVLAYFSNGSWRRLSDDTPVAQ